MSGVDYFVGRELVCGRRLRRRRSEAKRDETEQNELLQRCRRLKGFTP
jgi:hypothetical protein